jgi:hypothetical protein
MNLIFTFYLFILQNPCCGKYMLWKYFLWKYFFWKAG